MKRHVQYLMAFGALVSILAFQNCNPVSHPVQFSKTFENASSSTEGNGQGYDGKVYLSLGDLCPDSTNIRAKIILKNAVSGQLVRNNCQDITPLALTEKDFQINPANADQLTYSSNTFISQVPTAGVVLDVTKALQEGGFRYTVFHNFGTAADTSLTLTQSRVQIFENGIALGPAHSVHADIETLGQGRFSHWLDQQTEFLYFSASDNSDPSRNGRVYSYIISN